MCCNINRQVFKGEQNIHIYSTTGQCGFCVECWWVGVVPLDSSCSVNVNCNGLNQLIFVAMESVSAWVLFDVF